MTRAILRGPLSRSAGIRVLPTALREWSTAQSRPVPGRGRARPRPERPLHAVGPLEPALQVARVRRARLGPSRAGRLLRVMQPRMPAAPISVPKHPGVLPGPLSSAGRAGSRPVHGTFKLGGRLSLTHSQASAGYPTAPSAVPGLGAPLCPAPLGRHPSALSPVRRIRVTETLSRRPWTRLRPMHCSKTKHTNRRCPLSRATYQYSVFY